jgi:hypothetical protein
MVSYATRRRSWEYGIVPTNMIHFIISLCEIYFISEWQKIILRMTWCPKSFFLLCALEIFASKEFSLQSDEKYVRNFNGFILHNNCD